MRNLQLKKIAIALSFGAAVTAHAAGLGTMTSSSKLGEPLNAEIELLAVTPAELNSLQAVLASEQVYQDQMLEKPASYPFIKIEVGNNSKGQPILKLSSSQPITEAFLDMLIQVDWPTGRLVKEYTLLLDPPGFNSNYVAESASVPVITPTETPKASPSNTETVNSTAAPLPAAPASRPQPKAKPSAEKKDVISKPSDAQDALTTTRGDTLYAIARQMKPDNVSTEQMLAALYQSNQQAFDGKNMNRLKVGKIIRMPDQATLDSVSRQQAKQVVAEHHADWLAYKNALGKAVQASAPSKAGGHAQQSAGKIGAADDKPVPAAKPGKDVLKLSAGDEKSTAQADKTNGKPSATAAQEEATAKANAMQEEQSRAAALEKQVADMKKLMAMKNSAMAQAEKNAAQAAIPPDTKAETPTVAPEQKSAEPPKTAEAPKVPAPAPAKTEAEKPAAAPQPKEVVAPAVAPEQPLPEQPSFMHVLIERLKGINPVLPWALLSLPVLLGVWALIRIRRKKEIDNFEDVIVTSPATELQKNTVFGDTQAAASGDTSFLTDFSQSGVGGMIDSHDVDPIAEAEVYMAYGRDAQAEEILKDAIQKDPERHELKLKLMEIYQATNNKAAFESLASDVYAKVGPDDAVWAKVSALGQKLDSENPLYQVGASSAASAATEESVDVTQDDVPVAADVPAEEEAYHLNFEAPALEFGEAVENTESAVAPEVIAASPVTPTVADAFVVDAGEPVLADGMADALSIENDAFSSSSDIAPALEFEPSPAFTTAPSLNVENEAEGASAEQEAAVPAAVEVSAEPDAELTPKALDLPSLNLDDGVDSVAIEPALSMAPISGEQSLSNDDAVFESLPELSLELGGPNDSQLHADQDNGLEIEEITLDDSVDALNAPAAFSAPAEEIEFPEISLDVAASPLETEAGIEAESEEVNTKLDLIQAYIDMEDYIGAKELIEEVQSEGGELQRQRAGELLAKLP